MVTKESSPNDEPYYVPYSIVKRLILDYAEARRLFTFADTQEERHLARKTMHDTLAAYRDLIGWNTEDDEDYSRILNGYTSPRTASVVRFIAISLGKV